MKKKYSNIIDCAKDNGGILDAMLAAQKLDGYLTEEAIRAIAQAYNITPSKAYETASFYSMIRLEPKGLVQIEICRGAPCHVSGAKELISAVEDMLGIKIGETSSDGKYSFEYTECLGQCQDAPSMLVNGKLYTKLSIKSITEILKKEGVNI